MDKHVSIMAQKKEFYTCPKVVCTCYSRAYTKACQLNKGMVHVRHLLIAEVEIVVNNISVKTYEE